MMKNDTSPVTIMIIDDEPANLSVLGTMLRDAGWEVRAFPRGALALAAARMEAPDLILLDIRMPEMDGYEVCRCFKADPELEGIPIIFLSAFTNLDDKVRAFEIGGLDYVTKPFAEVEVQARVRTHLRLRRHQLELEELVEQRVQELAEAHRRLQIWDGAKSEWLNVLSHEMRTPLNGLVGISEVLFHELPPESEHHALRGDFIISCDRIEKLMNDAVTLAQIDVDATNFAVSAVSLAQTLRNAQEWVAEHVPGSEIHAELAAIADIAIPGEPRLLSRAFGDLLLTAAHCVTDGEPIKVTIEVNSEYAKVLITVGEKPLPTRGLETFFEVGGQRVLLKGGGDFGLGAALASRIIRLFRGQVGVRNGPGLLMEATLPIIAH
jgi:two-component system sensor histidine kinase/response regulator